MVIPELNKLKHTLSIESTESTNMPTLREDLLANIDQRWPNYEYKSIYAVSTIVDPIYKDCGFNESSASECARNLVMKEMLMNWKQSTTSSHNEMTTSEGNILHLQYKLMMFKLIHLLAAYISILTLSLILWFCHIIST